MLNEQSVNVEMDSSRVGVNQVEVGENNSENKDNLIVTVDELCQEHQEIDIGMGLGQESDRFHQVFANTSR